MAEETEVPAEAAEETPVEETKEEVEVTEENKEEVAEEILPIPPKKKSAQERIDEITRARREAEREREYWKQVALTKEKDEPLPAQRPPSFLPPRPTLDQFETTTAYEDALFTWRDNVKEIQTQVARQREAHDGALRTFNERAKNLRAEHEDFDEVIESPVFSPVMRITLLNSENGPAVAYHLGLSENRTEADRIRRLPLEMQPYELGKLETKLLLAKETKKVTQAPPPIKPVGMIGGEIEVDSSKMSTAEWMAWDKKKRMEKLKAKYG